MKRILFAIFLTLIITSCSGDEADGSPSIEGQVNGSLFFHTTNTSASIADDGSLIITGNDSGQELNLKTESFERGTFILGQGNENEATFRVNDSTLYSTGSVGSGEITIDRIRNGAVSGQAYFYARIDGAGDTLNFAQGAFFEIPVDSISGPDQGLTCEEATTARNTAAENYNQANQEDENFSELCTAYKNALQDEIDICEDPNNELQSLIDELPCSNSISCADAENAVTAAKNAYDQANPDNADQFQIVCQAYKEALQTQIEACGDESGDIQTIIDGLDCGN